MIFEELTEKEFTDFGSTHEHASFFQTVGWGKLKSQTGWKYYLLGVKRNKKVIAATMVLEKKLIGRKKIFYAPRGILIDYNDAKTLEFFVENLKKFAKDKKAVFFKMDPYITLHERDKDGNILDSKADEKNYLIIDNIKKAGFKHLGFNLEQEDHLQARWMFVCKTENKTVEDIWGDMSKTVKRIINKNRKLGLYVERVNGEEDIKEFVSVMDSTATRKHFSTRSVKYYSDMQKCLKDEDIFYLYLIKVSFKEMIDSLTKEVSLVKDQINEMEQKKSQGIISNFKKYDSELKVLNDNKENLEKQITEASTYYKEYGDITTLGAVLYMVYGNEVLGLYGGAYKEFINYSPFYTMHDYMLQKCIKENYLRYNYYAISGNLNPKDPLYNIYQVKRSFGGQIIELIGEFDLVFNKFWYYSYKIGYKSLLTIKKLFNKKKTS